LASTTACRGSTARGESGGVERYYARVRKKTKKTPHLQGQTPPAFGREMHGGYLIASMKRPEGERGLSKKKREIKEITVTASGRARRDSGTKTKAIPCAQGGGLPRPSTSEKKKSVPTHRSRKSSGKEGEG